MRSKPAHFLFRNALRWSALIIGLLITLSLAGYHLYYARGDQSSVIKRLDYLLYDWRFNLLHEEQRFERADANILIVDIDERSLNTVGRWPWPRDKLAALTQALTEAGAVVVAFDIMMTEPQPNPTRDLQQRARQNGQHNLADAMEEFVPATEFDRILADSFCCIDVVMPLLFQDDPGIRVGQLPQPILSLTPEQDKRLRVVHANGYTASVPILQEAAITAGSIAPKIDGDGTLRSVPLVTRFEGDLYPSLALATGMAYYFLDAIELKTARFNSAIDVIEGIQFADQFIRTDDAGRVLVPYLGPQGQFPYISATDVLEGRIDPARFENGLVFVGTSAIGLSDLRSTPVGPQFPGVEVHATLLNGLLTGDFPYTPVSAHTIIASLLLVLGVVFSIISSRLGPIGLVTATGVLLGALVSINFYFWAEQNAALPLASSILLTLALGGLHLLEGFISERRNKQHIANVFGQYVPKAHIDHMLNDPDAYGFEGENRDMTVLFSDVRSFTTISESLSATELKDLLNRYFTPITEVIFNHQGTIDKYVGDMVMAFWGAPLEDPDHALHALEAADEMIKTLDRLNPELAELGYPAIDVGIGLNTGPMNVGDMGSNFRRAYTVLGDAVNLGSRLESLTKFYGVKILVGPDTRARIDGWVFRPVDRIRVKGKQEPVAVFEPLGRVEEVDDHWFDELSRLETAYRFYLNQEWESAREVFEQLAKHSKRPKLYRVYLERIIELRSQALPEGWDGTYTHTSK
ncbi:CHASE2 domain-containing protein [Saccharospirillum salsuginis]|nr:adenylate/guanylate cyclase domain-containing protein [Saccharospirillum salsuginis]